MTNIILTKVTHINLSTYFSPNKWHQQIYECYMVKF